MTVKSIVLIDVYLIIYHLLPMRFRKNFRLLNASKQNAVLAIKSLINVVESDVINVKYT